LNKDTGYEAIANGNALYRVYFGDGYAKFLRTVTIDELKKYQKYGTIYI